MATAILSMAEAFLARLTASPAIMENIKRTHLVPVERDESPAIQIQVGRIGKGSKRRGNCIERTAVVRVSVIVRDDESLDAMDPYLEAVAERLDPMTEGFQNYGSGVVPDLEAIDFDEDIADADALRCNMDYRVSFFTPENRLTVV